MKDFASGIAIGHITLQTKINNGSHHDTVLPSNKLLPEQL